MNHSFRLNKNGGNRPKTDNSLIIMIVFISISIVSLIIFFTNQSSNSIDKQTNKELISVKDNSHDYIYTVLEEENETEEDTLNEVPAINLDGEKYELINEEILEQYESVKSKIEYDYLYQYNVSGNILSLLITASYIPKEGNYPVTSFKSYNIDLENGSVLSNKKLLEKFDLTEKNLNSFISGKFNYHYRKLITDGYYTEEECSYECFLNNRGITVDYLAGISLYVDDSKLMVYKFYYKESDYSEEEYFENVPYGILVKE